MVVKIVMIVIVVIVVTVFVNIPPTAIWRWFGLIWPLVTNFSPFFFHCNQDVLIDQFRDFFLDVPLIPFQKLGDLRQRSDLS